MNTMTTIIAATGLTHPLRTFSTTWCLRHTFETVIVASDPVVNHARPRPARLAQQQYLVNFPKRNPLRTAFG